MQVPHSQLAIVSGGSRGLGQALCQRFVDDGFRVIEFSRSAPHVYSVPVDFGSPSTASATIRQALSSLANEAPWQQIVAISNAAVITPIGPASRQETYEIVRTLDASFTSAILFMTEVIAAFQSRACRKSLLNISSGGALRGQAGLSLYCGAKAGLENFVRAVAIEQQGEAFPFIAANVDPGAMDTNMQVAITGSSAADFPDVQRFIDRKQAGTLRQPVAVAAAVARIAALPDLAGGGRYNVGDYGV